MKCNACEQIYVESTGDYHFKSSGLDNAYIEDVRLIKCGCGVGLKIKAMGSVLDQLGNAVINKPGPLSGQEIRYLRKNAGLSAREFARLLEVNHTTLSKWENGRAPGRASDLLIRFVYAAWKEYQHPKRIFDSFKQARKQKKRNIGIKLIPAAGEGFEVEYAAVDNHE
ncbi:MAG: helix-turn-helix domain-containing protein [Nitrospinae bacterium]|nr:helix-turn-helix domain-containing protein [Nitrospinota bacterium]